MAPFSPRVFLVSLTPSEVRWQCSDMSLFRTPQVVLFTRDIDRASAFYHALGFEEVFRTPLTGTPIHVDFALDCYRIGLATEASTRDDHELDPVAVARAARGRVLLDGRNCMPGDDWREAGWTYRALGRGAPERPAGRGDRSVGRVADRPGLVTA